MAWSHVLANEKFGAIVTQNLGGYTWNKNSRLNRITKWSNDSILDTPPESIFIQDIANKKVWRIGEGNLLATYGFGYAKYNQNKTDLKTELIVFVPKDENSKINILRIKNNTNNLRKINLIYKLDLVLGEDELKTNNYINLRFDSIQNKLIAKSLYHIDLENEIFITSNEKIDSYTGNENNININNINSFNNENSLGNGNTIAIKVNLELNSFEEKEIYFIIADKQEKIKVNESYKKLEDTKKYWNNIVEKIKVKTPIESINIMLNGWVMYQTIASRLYARSGFYQSGGAFGFRDQLQDCISLKYTSPEIIKKQILKHAEHQFMEGDVLHWWHDETGRGVRTKFSDDRLWLVYLVLEYIEATGDNTILDIEIPYLVGEKLKENEDEKYELYNTNNELKESIYNHCIRAIEISLNFGENNLPLIGSGDWNDGFSTVGNKGKGESVWLGFFLYDVLNKFIKIVEQRNDIDKVKKYLQIINILKTNLNNVGWDGRWYKEHFVMTKKF